MTAPIPASPPRILRHPLWWALGLAVLIPIAGWQLTHYVADYGDTSSRNQLRALATTVATGIEPELVKTLDGDPSDLGTPPYDLVREELQRVREAHAPIHQAYLLGQRNGALVVLVGSVAPTTANVFAPGQVYDDDSGAMTRAWSSGQALAVGPYQDDWGEWVSGLAPIIEPASGKVVGLVGLDLDAGEWRLQMRAYRSFGLLITLFVTLLLLVFIGALAWQYRHNRKISELNQALQQELHERLLAQRQLRLAAAVINSTAEGIMVVNREGIVQSVNPAFEEITGYRAAEVVGKSATELNPEHRNDRVFEQVRETLEQDGEWHGLIWSRRKNGERYPQEVFINAVYDDEGQVSHFAVLFSDVTEQQAIEQRLRELSSVDGLTGVSNRRAFDEALANEWFRARREQEALALIMIDIDYFKYYNDSYGHQAGDECLKQVAQAIDHCVHRAGDVVARYGGEEFAVILPLTPLDKAEALAETLRQAVEDLAIAHRQSPVADHVTVSLGVAARQPGPHQEPDELVGAADNALYRAKHRGRNRVQSVD